MKICQACQYRFRTTGWQCPICGHVPQKDGGFESVLNAALNFPRGGSLLLVGREP